MMSFIRISSLFLLVGVLFAFTQKQEPLAEEVKWYSWEEAVELNKENPKKLFVDVYTDWCGWCKVMDKQTFTQREVAAYLNEHFYAVKLNAEQREDIIFNNNTFKYISTGKRGVHQLAYSLLGGKMSYPSIVYLNENFERIATSPGYKKPEDILPELRFSAEEYYKTVSWQEYMAKIKAGK